MSTRNIIYRHVYQHRMQSVRGFRVDTTGEGRKTENEVRAERESKDNKPGSKVQLKAVKLQLSRAGDVVSAKNKKKKKKTLKHFHPQHVTTRPITS